MNIENLKRMADYIEDIPQDQFSMKFYRGTSDRASIKCNSVGCVIGHCVVLDNSENIPLMPNGDIDFISWSFRFTGLRGDTWDWCFAGDWGHIDNTPTGAAKRIRYLIENGLPEDWEGQINGYATISYM